MTNDDPNNPPDAAENQQSPDVSDANVVSDDTAIESDEKQKTLGEDAASAAEGSEAFASDPAGASEEAGDSSQDSRRRILIGSQRDPAAYRARRVRDWTPVVDSGADEATTKATDSEPAASKPAGERRPGKHPSGPRKSPGGGRDGRRPERKGRSDGTDAAQGTAAQATSGTGTGTSLAAEMPAESVPGGPVPKPSVRDRLTPDLEEELNQAMGSISFDTLMEAGSALGEQAMLEEESRHTGRVVAIRRDDVFVELGSREQGCISMKQFEQPPEVGAAIEVVVQRFNPEDGLYELTLPGRAVSVDDWGDLKEGMLVDAHVTGHNTGGLECEVNHLRGFLPVSQIAMYRVEDLAQFVGEKFTCVITEANPERRNLVLSRRAVLEREKEEARQNLLGSLQPGQIHDGVVRKLMPFGAFIDIGGIDGLLHISQLAWHRVEHPSEVLSEGQTIKVKIEKIDHATGKMSLAYREMIENPWEAAARKYPANSIFEGTVTRLMEFGAFVEMEKGIEGLVHISELSHKRIWRASDVVHEGDKVQVMVLSVDPGAQRMSLSIRQTTAAPEPVKKEDERTSEPQAETAKSRKHRSEHTLRGGIGRAKGGEKFGLKW